MIDARAPDLWTIDHPLRLGGVEFGTRTTLVRLSSGDIFVHSPGPLGGGLGAQISALGSVRALVAPNKLHHLFVAENARAFPEATVYLAPGLAARRPQLPPAQTLQEQSPELWAGQLEQVWVRGAPTLEEVVFFHRASRTLLLTDLAFNFGAVSPWFSRVFLRAAGAYQRFGPSRVARRMLRDRDLVGASLAQILAWDFDRIVVAHGDVLESGGSV